MKSKLLVATLAACCVSVFVIADAQSAPASFSFIVDATQGVFGAPGSSTVLATQTVDSSVVGRSCQVTVDVHNNDSVRQGTDLLFVSSTGVSLTAANVEGVAGDAPPTVVGELMLGPTLTVSVRFGPEGAASVGATIIVECPDVSPTTTLAPTATTQPALAVGGAEVARDVSDLVVAQPTFTG